VYSPIPSKDLKTSASTTAKLPTNIFEAALIGQHRVSFNASFFATSLECGHSRGSLRFSPSNVRLLSD
jgi:hypothetical protein